MKDALQSEVFVWKSIVSFSFAIHQSDGRCARVIHLTASYYSPFPLFLSLTLQPCFLKYACPTFFSPTTLQNSNGCPSLVPLFSSAFLCFICGWPNFQVGSIMQFGDWRGRMSSIETDRHKRHTSQLAWMPLLCPLECPPTPITRIARLSSLAAKLAIFCYHGGCTVRYTLPAPPLYYLQFCERSKDSAIVLLILCNRAAENPQRLHIAACWAVKKKRFIRVRKVDSLILPRGSRPAACVFIWPHIVT